MGDVTPDHTWDELFDEIYLRTYAFRLPERDSPAEAEAAAKLAGVEPPAAVLDAPTGFGRHALPLAKLGYHVTGVDRSEVQLAEARRIAGDVEWPVWVRADVRELPFDEASFDGVLCLFTSIGYRGEDGDRQAFGEFLRVLRPGAAVVVECLHRDRLMSIFQERSWEPLADGAVLLEERRFDHVTGEVETEHTLLSVGERRSVGFAEVDCFGDLEGGPLSRETRLVVRARKP